METERLHCVRRIISELSDIEWPSVIGRSAHPSVIKQDQLVRRREPIDERRIPVSNGGSEPRSGPEAVDHFRHDDKRFARHRLGLLLTIQFPPEQLHH